MGLPVDEKLDRLEYGGPELKKGIRSTDLAQSYNRSGKKYQKLKKELQEWAAAGFPILRVLVTAGVQGKAK